MSGLGGVGLDLSPARFDTPDGRQHNAYPPSSALVRQFVALGQDLDIIQVNGFPALMDDSHKMITAREPRGLPHEVEGLLVEAVWLIVNEHRHRPEIRPALIAQTDSFPYKTEKGFLPNAS